MPGGDYRDLLVPWRAPGGPHVDRYYRTIGLDELADLLEGVGFTIQTAMREGANHVVQVTRPG